jgi:hypothetical protein
MLGQNYYWGLTRKYVTLFGTIFDDIYIDRVDADGVSQKTIKVPLQYGPKERYLTRYIQNPDLLREVSMVFPRMSFEITSIKYDADRKKNTIGRVSAVGASGGSLTTQYNPVPYNYDITLSIISRNTEDALRIVEQILPFFTPQWNATVNLIPEMNYSVNIPIVLNTVQCIDTYASNFENKEWVIWELTFTLKGVLWGPSQESGVIKEIIVNTYIPHTNTAAEGVGVAQPTDIIDVQPGLTANGQPTSNAAQSIPSSQIKASDNYGYIVGFTEDVNNG